MIRARAWVPLAAGAALAAAAACFSERGAGPIVAAAAECRVPVKVIDSMHILIAIRNFTFVPDSIAVRVGATVTWVDCEDVGEEAHTTTSDTPGVWDSPLLTSGARFSHRFPVAGVFPYHCTPHFDVMKGTVVVQ